MISCHITNISFIRWNQCSSFANLNTNEMFTLDVVNPVRITMVMAAHGSTQTTLPFSLITSAILLGSDA